MSLWVDKLARALLAAASLSCSSSEAPSNQLDEALFCATGDGRSSIEALAAGENGWIFAGGYFEGSFAWGGQQRQSNGGRDGFVAALDANAEPAWLYTFGGLLQDEVATLSLVESDGTLVAGGWHGDRVDFDPSLGERTFSRPGRRSQAALVGLGLDGELRFARVLPAVIDADSSSITSLASYRDEIWAAGVASGNLRSGEGSGALQRTENFSQAGFVARVSLAGEVRELRLFDSILDDTALVGPAEPPLVAGRWAGSLELEGTPRSPIGTTDAFLIQDDDVKTLGGPEASVDVTAVSGGEPPMLFGSLRGSAFGLEAEQPTAYVAGWSGPGASPTIARLLAATHARAALATARGSHVLVSTGERSQLLLVDAQGRTLQSLDAYPGSNLRALAASASSLLVAGSLQLASGHCRAPGSATAFVARQALAK